MKRLISTNQIKFKEDGYLMVLGSPAYLLSLNVLVLTYQLLSEDFGKKGRDIFYKMLEAQTRMGAKMMIKRFGYSPEKGLKMQMGHAEMIGAGTIELIKVDTKNNHYILRAKSTFAKEYLNTFGIQKNPVDDLFRGGIAALLQEMAKNKNLICIETKCIAQGKPYCEFVVKDKKHFDLKDPKIKAQIPSKFKFKIEEHTESIVPIRKR